MSSTRVWFADWRAKACYLDGAAWEDAQCPEVRALAAPLHHLPPEARARALYALVRARVRYRTDPPPEQLADAPTVLGEGADDCDGSVRLLVALLLAAGLEAHVRAVLSREPDGSIDLVHFQAETRWPGSDVLPLAGPGGWILCETTLAGIPFGAGAELARLDAEGEPIKLL